MQEVCTQQERQFLKSITPKDVMDGYVPTVGIAIKQATKASTGLVRVFWFCSVVTSSIIPGQKELAHNQLSRGM